jgi:hypothetical protein
MSNSSNNILQSSSQSFVFRTSALSSTCNNLSFDQNKLSIHDYFDNKSNHFIPGIHYISVGSAMLLAKHENEVSQDYCQQYPPFIQDIKNNYPEVNITILLMDSVLEQVPYCITNQLQNYVWNNNEYSNVFVGKLFDNTKQNNVITIYCFNDMVNWLPGEQIKNTINIYNQLLIYQNKIIDNADSLLFFHDFTGRDVSELATIMDNVLKNNRKYVMYDITVRKDAGCYVKLNDDINKPIIIRENKRLEIFNPFNITNTSTFISNLGKEQKNISNMIEQLMLVIKRKIIDWEEHFTLYRQLLSNDAKKNNMEMSILNKEIYKDIKKAYMLYCNSLQKKNLEYCLDLAKNSMFISLRNSLNTLPLDDFTKDQCIISYEEQLLTTNNIFNWGNNINGFLNTLVNESSNAKNQ